MATSFWRAASNTNASGVSRHSLRAITFTRFAFLRRWIWTRSSRHGSPRHTRWASSGTLRVARESVDRADYWRACLRSESRFHEVGYRRARPDRKTAIGKRAASARPGRMARRPDTTRCPSWRGGCPGCMDAGPRSQEHMAARPPHRLLDLRSAAAARGW